MRTASPSILRVCAIVVTYHPSESVRENVALLSREFANIVVIDNGSPANFENILSKIGSLPGVKLICNQSNLGIAAALNAGIRLAQALEFEWIATFDQDSSITEGYVSWMMSAYLNCPYRDRVGLISPVHCADQSGFKFEKRINPSESYSLILWAMTSGNMVKAGVFAKSGFFDESLFIDYVDFDFCMRLRQCGYKSIQASQTWLIHHLGNLEMHSFLGFPITIKSHNSVRYYYIMRNRLVMYRRYALRVPFWAIHDSIWLCIDLIKIIFFEDDKVSKFFKIIEGFRDGVLGRLGPYFTGC